MKIIVFIAFLSTSIAIHAQARPATCEVEPSWRVIHGVGSGKIRPMGVFETDHIENSTIHSYKDKATNSVVTVAVIFGFASFKSKSKLFQIEVAIAVSGQEKT